MRAVAIVNLRARNGGAARRWPAIEAALREGFPSLDVRLTESRGHATRLAREALEGGADLLISVGGDGTNNEVLAGFVDEEGKPRFPDASFAFVAAGTGGDFSRNFPVADPVEHARALGQAHSRRIDYGVARFTDAEGNVRSRPFLNLASAGISGQVDRHVEGASRALGTVATYVFASLRAIANHRDVEVEVQVDDEPVRRMSLSLVCVANGQYMGGGMWISPPARLDDGQLHAVLLSGFSRFRLVMALARVFGGRHLGWGGIEDRHVRRVRLSTVDDSEVLIDLDGEQPGRLPVEFRVEAGGLKLLVPS